MNQPEDKIKEDKDGFACCSECGEMLTPISDNVGYDEPNGPSKWETVGYEKCSCLSADEWAKETEEKVEEKRKAKIAHNLTDIENYIQDVKQGLLTSEEAWRKVGKKMFL